MHNAMLTKTVLFSSRLHQCSL